MKEYFLQTGQFNDPPGYKEEKQTMVNEDQINEAFNPANDTLLGLREVGNWVMDFVSDFATQIFGNLM